MLHHIECRRQLPVRDGSPVFFIQHPLWIQRSQGNQEFDRSSRRQFRPFSHLYLLVLDVSPHQDAVSH